MRIHQEEKEMSYEKEIEELKAFYMIRGDLKLLEINEGKRIIKKHIINKNKEKIEEETKKRKENKGSK